MAKPKYYERTPDDYVDHFLMTAQKLGELHGCLEGMAFCYRQRRKKGKKPGHEAAFLQMLGGEAMPKDQAELLDRLAVRLKALCERLFDDTLCNDNCKSMYFCELKRGHRGQHRYW